MEVDKIAFYPLFLDILSDISKAHFVAFDLELSGVPTKSANTGKARGRPSLQERYTETKDAAERYQVLQIGLTCVTQDVENKKYILQPYNFELSPLIEERGIDIERNFSFSSSAVDFLMRVNFDMSLPFYHGIPYLSREETKLAREKFHQRNDKTAIADIQLKPTETESLAFVDRVREEVNAWIKSTSQTIPEYVIIGKHKMTDAVDDEGDPIPMEGLSRFEKRLVHQLVRAEYPELTAFGKRDLMYIKRFDKQREDDHLASRLKELNERIGRQKGFRWIIEALHGSQITELDLRECARDPATGEHVFADMDDYNAQFNRAHAILRENPRMLVGHNCFLDLVYLYRTFIGPLPDKVEDFQRKIHAFWPNIVDTKYMSTHNCGDINLVSSLEEIASRLSIETTPTLEIVPEHMKYASGEALHEAGYDSFLTAQIAIRLSAKLQREGSFADTNDAINEKHISNGIDNLVLKKDEPTEVASANSSSTSTDPPIPTPVSSSSSNGFVPSEVGGRWKHRGDPSLPPQDPEDPFEYKPTERRHHYHDSEGEKAFVGGMPARSSEFWKIYGNKLRVFGTEEAVCVLQGDEEAEDEMDNEAGSGGVKVA